MKWYGMVSYVTDVLVWDSTVQYSMVWYSMGWNSMHIVCSCLYIVGSGLARSRLVLSGKL